MDQEISTVESPASITTYGGKAYWLSWLFQHHYNVPYAVFLPAVESGALDEIFNNQSQLSRLRELLKPINVDEKYNVAVRSSATCEDSQSRSFAGQFKTLLGLMTFEEILDCIKQVVNSVKRVDTKGLVRMAVIVQKRIEAAYSGVAFSSNPLTGAKFQCVVGVVPGMGGALVAGESAGEDVILTKDGDALKIPQYTTGIPESDLREIWNIAKEIESDLCYPVDIEWCVERNSGALYVLQCRPATGILYEGEPIIQVSARNQQRFPSLVVTNEKVNLRMLGEKTGVLVSKAFLAIANCVKNPPVISNLSIIRPSRDCRGYSVVLIYPRTVSGKVVRHFVSRVTQSGDRPQDGERYRIKSRPEHGNLRDCISSIAEICSDQYWTSIMIVQEIFDPKYTGVVKRISDGYIVELAQGHFVPKGIVPTSQYIISLGGQVLYSSEVSQPKRFRILDGYVLEEGIDVPESQVSVGKGTLSQIVQDFKQFLKNEQTTVEFGLLRPGLGKTLKPYLIDFVQDQSHAAIDSQSVLEGVVSRGMVTGKIVSFEQVYKSEESFNSHFHDKSQSESDKEDSYIFLCEKPDISLLKVIDHYSPQKLGFIFREGSVLCHLAIVLREQRIPAIIVRDLAGMKSGRVLTIDAITPGLKGKERVHLHDQEG